VDLADEYVMQTGSGERPLTLRRPVPVRLAASEAYFATVHDACRP
jgi:hypothetical protein